MSQGTKVSVENNFSAGLKTENSPLNFPSNACTDVDNCLFSITGTVFRRSGFDYETNYQFNTVDRTGKAISEYRWLNAGGDGETQIYVYQVGSMLFFFLSSAATVDNPLSTQKLAASINLTAYQVTGSSFDPSTIECQYTDGNGYLFVYNQYCEPFYCSYSNLNINSTPINVQIRDFNGIVEDGVAANFRSPVLSNEHSYNLQNQGWTNPPSWTSTSTDANGFIAGDPIFGTKFMANTGDNTFTVPSGLTVSPGDPVNLVCNFATVDGEDPPVFTSGTISGTGRIISYSGTSMVVFIDVISTFYRVAPFLYSQTWNLTSGNNKALIATWQTDIGNYPSNADVWWRYKDSTDTFNPAATINSKTYPTSPASQGHFILDAFNQQQSTVSSVPDLTPITTYLRPRTGTWFAGRVWYAGVDAAQPDTGDQKYYTWTENIYFSQIITTSTQFGLCYQTNDPTDENLFGLLPSDGGVVQIQGCGSVHKLFPIQNGMLVFADNGIWFITGSQGIGFTATDYTVTKISNVQSISSSSFINVIGLPYFWNEEGIYTVEPAQQGLGLTVNPLTTGTILSFYNSIPKDSKRYVRGGYNPIDYVAQWIYRNTQETTVTDRYEFDRVLNYNTFTKAFYPYTIESTTNFPHVNGIMYISSPSSANSPDPRFKYLCSIPSAGSYNFTFAEESSDTYEDWYSVDNVGLNYESFFVTGYKLDGQAQRQFQPYYIYMFSKNDTPTAYKIQGIWNFASSGNSGNYSSQQLININKPYYGTVFRRHRIRGHGIALQFKISSVNGQPFELIGWSLFETQNASI